MTSSYLFILLVIHLSFFLSFFLSYIGDFFLPFYFASHPPFFLSFFFSFLDPHLSIILSFPFFEFQTSNEKEKKNKQISPQIPSSAPPAVELVPANANQPHHQQTVLFLYIFYLFLKPINLHDKWFMVVTYLIKNLYLLFRHQPSQFFISKFGRNIIVRSCLVFTSCNEF